MAYNNHASSFFLIALTLFAIANPLSHAANLNPTGISVPGQLCCTPTGNCPGQPILGAVVKLNCTSVLGVSVTIGQNTTNVNGNFNITVPNVLGPVPNLPNLILPCNVTVSLPLNQTICPILSTVSGTLVSSLQFFNIVLTQVVGFAFNTSVTGFVNVTLPL